MLKFQIGKAYAGGACGMRRQCRLRRRRLCGRCADSSAEGTDAHHAAADAGDAEEARRAVPAAGGQPPPAAPSARRRQARVPTHRAAKDRGEGAAAPQDHESVSTERWTCHSTTPPRGSTAWSRITMRSIDPTNPNGGYADRPDESRPEGRPGGTRRLHAGLRRPTSRSSATAARTRSRAPMSISSTKSRPRRRSPPRPASTPRSTSRPT